MHQLLRIVMKEKLHFARLDMDRTVRILDIGRHLGSWDGLFSIYIQRPF